MKKIYVVTAYRWGETDNHSYVVGASLSLRRAKKIAQEEAEWRDGKYGVEIIRVEGGKREQKREKMFYVSSRFGEERLTSQALRKNP